MQNTGFIYNLLNSLRKVKSAAFHSIKLVTFICVSMNVQAITAPGTVIENTATASFDFSATAASVVSNTVSIVSSIIPTPSTLTLYQYSSTLSADRTLSTPSEYATSGPPGTGFVSSPNPVLPVAGSGSVTLDAMMPQNLVITSVYSSGEPIFAVLEDQDQNLDAIAQETVIVVVTGSTGDREEIRLTETGLDSGEFAGYIQSALSSVRQYDGVISLAEDTVVSLSYIDPSDPSDVSEGTSLVDPIGVIFNSIDGQLIDGATVSIVDPAGNPVSVFGVDNISTYPGTIISGGSATDSSGVIYEFPHGGYRFPRLPVGQYKLLVQVPDYMAPSTSSISDLNNLPDAPYALSAEASFAQVFTLASGLNNFVDIPVDPVTSYLVIDKSSSKESAAIGDFVQYTVNLKNTSTTLVSSNTEVVDTLPVGFRYQRGSAQLNAVATEPVISADGRKLTFSVPTLVAASSISIKYVTELTVATKLGKAVNSVIAQDDFGAISNTAVSAITVSEDLFASRSFIAGRVIVGSCEDDASLINPGLPAVRLFMEDGSYAATDENGRFHFEGIKPGTHVVQLDKDSIADNLEVIDCVKNTRYAGTPYSQFVDLQGGTLWRTDFYVREKQAITDKATLGIGSEVNAGDISYSIELSNGKIAVDNYRLIVSLPDDVEYTMGSSSLNSVALDDPVITENILVYRLGSLGDNWNKKLSLRGRLRNGAEGEQVTTALMIVDTQERKNIRSTPVRNKLAVSQNYNEGHYVYLAYFEPMGSDLSDISKTAIREAVSKLGDAEIKSIEITGYTDNRPVSGRSAGLYGDNAELSESRAKVVSEFLANELKINREIIIVKGGGETNPIASNQTVSGRSLNRRVELVITTREIVGEGKVKLLGSASDSSEVMLEGQPEYKLDKLIEDPPVTEQLDFSSFDELWIRNVTPGYAWLTPDASYSPAIPSVNLAIKHLPGDDYEMLLNGEPVNPLFYFGMIKNKAVTVARSYWQGIHLDNGTNHFEFIVKDKDGNIVKKMIKDIVLAGYPVRAELAQEYSRLIADGRNVPVVALRVFDKDNHPARPGSRGEYTLSEPYISQQAVEAYQVNRLSGKHREKAEYTVGQNGIAFIVLEPTTVTGKLNIELPFSGRKNSHLQTWVQPEIRDWILVGLAEGNVGYDKVSGNLETFSNDGGTEEFSSDGKVAFYAKGRVKGEWLLTTSYDSSKETLFADNRVNQLIDPNTYYTIYGDNSRQRHDASSAERLYVKIERKQFYAMFGDMDTGLNVTELSKFSRNMTGVKSEYDDGQFAFTAFAAENKNNFIKDEIQGEGISGLYRLSGKDIVINSDNIVIETRDRFRSEIIIKTEVMRRYLDYSIDYSDGTIFFKRPIMSRDESFNPIFIVADYEVEAPVSGDMTAGGRAAIKLNEGAVELGASLVHDASYQNEGDLIGADARIMLNDKTEIKLEAATTDVTAGSIDLTGSAYSAEIIHGGDKLKTRAYAKQQDNDFGLGQQSVSQSGTRKYGAEAQYRVTEETAVAAKIYHEDVLSTGASRNVADTTVTYNKRDYTLSTGARIARDVDALGVANNSNLLLLGATRSLLADTVQLRANAEVAVNSANENIDYPSRYILGADYFVTSDVNLFAENEWTLGRDQDTQMARAGVRARPWTNAQINSAVNQETSENGVRSFATMGLTQGFPISKRWSGDIALDHARTLRTPAATPFDPDVPVAQGSTNNDFTAISLGSTYNAESYTVNNRVEYRYAELEDKYGMVINWERMLKGGIAYSATSKLFKTDRRNGSELLDGDIRLSTAYRPLQSPWIILNRLDFKFDADTDIIGIKTRQRKLIDNLTSNFLIDDRNQLAFNFGVKYVIDSFDGLEFNGIAGLIGTEYRHDISDVYDIGVHANSHYSANSGVTQYSTGVSLGWNMVRNIWLSVGYNFNGFDDRDFSAAGYTSQGIYLRFRMKFDQDTVAEVQNMFN